MEQWWNEPCVRLNLVNVLLADVLEAFERELAMGSTSSVRPRPARLQFSLRLLLIAFTAFAIGFPIWYRWPYQEVREEHIRVGPSILRSVVHWQRQWGGKILMHGKREDLHK